MSSSAYKRFIAASGGFPTVLDNGTPKWLCDRISVLKKAILLAETELEISTIMGMLKKANELKKAKNLLEQQMNEENALIVERSQLDSNVSSWSPMAMRRPALVTHRASVDGVECIQQ
jgi:hypothetical protein